MIRAEAAPVEQACCRIARSQDGLSQAFSLVYHSYVEAGLIEPNLVEARVLPHHAISSTEVLIATIRNEVFGTATLIRDSALGLPMESIYGSEIGSRRNQGLRLAEVSCLADRRRRTSQRSLIDLMISTIQCAKLRGVDHLLVAVHPRHVKFYLRVLGFHVFAGLRSYKAVRGFPAVGLCLDLNNLESSSPVAYRRIFGRRGWTDQQQLAFQPLPPAVKNYVKHLLMTIHSMDDCTCSSAAS